MNTLELLGISSSNLLIWIIFGLMIGLYAHIQDHRKAKGGVIFTCFFAVIGAVIGGYMANLLLAKAIIGFSIEGFITALISALVLAVFYRASFRNTGYINKGEINYVS